MELGVLLLLPLCRNVALDLAFAAVPADRADVVPVRPEFAAPEVLLDGRDPPEHLASRQAFDYAHDLCRAVRGNRLHEKMHVVPVRPDLEKPDLIARRDLQADVPQDFVHVRRDHRAPVLRRADDMVQQNRNIVTAMDELTHPLSLAQPDAASRGVLDPRGIKWSSPKRVGRI